MGEKKLHEYNDVQVGCNPICKDERMTILVNFNKNSSMLKGK